MSKTLTDRTLALAGIFQCATQVARVARRGFADSAAFETTIHSLFVTNPQETADVYGSRAALRPGLHELIRQIEARQERDVDITRYSLALLVLERKLAKRRELLDVISKGIQNAQRQADHFQSYIHDSVIGNLADTYLKSISLLTPRIMVKGENNFLMEQGNADKVRALLLAGIRSAVLWSQCGGSRWQLLFRRRSYLEEAERLLRSVPANN
ncbi:MAG TPA: high frequency lysogenization protein HflD [Gammaproteobacteria bacterium]